MNEATLTCPACGHQCEQEMPADRCVYFWECPACRQVLKPKAGDCCVFCSYGDRLCPSRSEAEGSRDDGGHEPP